MKKPNTHGRTRLLGAGGAPVTEEPPPSGKDAQNFRTRLKAKPHRPDVPLSHGKHSEQQVAAWDAEGQRRREGTVRGPAWQNGMRAGCTGCMARPGILPPDNEKARGMMLEWGWVFSAGRWICGTCAIDERNR